MSDWWFAGGMGLIAAAACTIMWFMLRAERADRRADREGMLRAYNLADKKREDAERKAEEERYRASRLANELVQSDSRRSEEFNRLNKIVNELNRKLYRAQEELDEAYRIAGPALRDRARDSLVKRMQDANAKAAGTYSAGRGSPQGVVSPRTTAPGDVAGKPGKPGGG